MKKNLNKFFEIIISNSYHETARCNKKKFLILNVSVAPFFIVLYIYIYI